jgi:transcriptional regulator with PAS, ATPase and Fis domain
MIEEVELSRKELQAAFLLARRGLSECQSKQLLLRQIAAADKVVSSLGEGEELSTEAVTEVLLTKSDLGQAVLEHEGSLIKQALTKVNGRVTHAAKLLGLSHQGLAYIIASRHPHLLPERSPILRRGKNRT